MATILLGVIGCLIGFLSKHIIYFTLIGPLIGYRIDSKNFLMTMAFGILGVIVGAITHHIMISSLIGLIIGFFIDRDITIFLRSENSEVESEENRKINEVNKRSTEANERSKLSKGYEYAEDHVSDSLSENVRKYLQTGRANENYYSCYNFNYCSPKINTQMNELLNDCREKLLLQVRNMKAVKDYNTPSGTIREVYVSGIVEHVHYWEHEESIHQPNTIGFNGYCIHVYRGSTGAEYWRKILKNHGFIAKKSQSWEDDEHSVQHWSIYAYIKL